jgi:hypothetical protein
MGDPAGGRTDKSELVTKIRLSKPVRHKPFKCEAKTGFGTQFVSVKKLEVG